MMEVSVKIKWHSGHYADEFSAVVARPMTWHTMKPTEKARFWRSVAVEHGMPKNGTIERIDVEHTAFGPKM